MFDSEFYPTPFQVIEEMVASYQINGKIAFEPSAGKGDIVDYLKLNGIENVIACELNDDLRKILSTKCKIINNDFFNVRSTDISHVDYIFMNPPFSNAQKHILHAWNIAPDGCKIVALCNINTIENSYTRERRELTELIELYGYYDNIGNVFDSAERKTNVNVALIHLSKPGNNYNQEFDGFFMNDDPAEDQVNGIMPYNSIRDIVNRYITAIKIFDEQLETARKLHELTTNFFIGEMGMTVTKDKIPYERSEFKKDLQKSAWKWIFDKLNMEKYSTEGLKRDINKFVEQQTKIPFTMRNIYRMLEIVVGTTSQRMDKALEEVFDKLTKHYHDNRYQVEGWKTNSYYLINQKFILPYLSEIGYSGGIKIRYDGNINIIEDMVKAICYMTGSNYDDQISLRLYCNYKYKIKRNGDYLSNYQYLSNSKKEIDKIVEDFYNQGIKIEIDDYLPEWGKWFKWSFFDVRLYKKGTAHFKFSDHDIWTKYNQNIARIKGYPLFYK